MKTKYILLAALPIALCVTACSKTSAPQIANTASPESARKEIKRSTPVIAERPARMYIWSGFDEKTCSATTPKFAVSKPPAKGTVSFKPNQTTVIKQSNSGKCIGQRLPGTGIYYTARNGQTGTDNFSITATTPQGMTATRSFQVQITN